MPFRARRDPLAQVPARRRDPQVCRRAPAALAVSVPIDRHPLVCHRAPHLVVRVVTALVAPRPVVPELAVRPVPVVPAVGSPRHVLVVPALVVAVPAAALAVPVVRVLVLGVRLELAVVVPVLVVAVVAVAQPVRSVVDPAVGPPVVASRRSSGAKSSTTCRPRRSAACRFRVAMVRCCGCRVARRCLTSLTASARTRRRSSR